LIPSRIQKVLSTMATRQVRALLMGGQACVFYGAAEFSRDADLVILADPENLNRLQSAMDDLQAAVVAVPPFRAEFLERGHAVHFRCGHPEATGMRVDIMSRLRGVDPFPALWERRTSLVSESGHYELISLPDLVLAKKTQRTKDWPMIRRLLEAHYLKNREAATEAQRLFWLRELRTPELLREAARRWPELSRRLAAERPLLLKASAEDLAEVELLLLAEEQAERERDRVYWRPLRAELERLRHAALRSET
jgi:hypothetical protein